MMSCASSLAPASSVSTSVLITLSAPVKFVDPSYENKRACYIEYSIG